MFTCFAMFIFALLSDPEYKKFLDYYNGDEEKLTSTTETLLEELEAKSKELEGLLHWLHNHHCMNLMVRLKNV